MFTLLKRTAILVITVLGLSAVPASADVPFGSGDLTGVDPLGHTWSAFSSGDFMAWGEPGLGLGTLNFNPLAVEVEPGITSATGLRFTFLDGTPAIDQVLPVPTLGGYTTETRFNLNKGGTWYAWTGVLSLSDHRIDFFDSTGELTINEGDEFFVNVHFAAPIDASSFSFAGNWIYAPVPEPEIYAMMGIGLALMGFVARRRNAS